MVRGGGGEGVSPDLLREILAEAGIPDFPGGAEQLAVHAGEMLRWNRSIRLTAITDPVEVAVKHVADSLLLLRFAPFPGRLLDFGAGAGYPGIPLALYLPGTRVTLLEASVKKCAFLSRARAMLRLSNVDVVHARAEKRKRLPLPPQDHIVTRATASAGEVIPLLSPYLAAAEQQPEVRTSDASAFTVTDAEENETAVLVVQCRETDPHTLESLAARLKQAIHSEFGIHCLIELVPPHTLPRTSSGKLSRSMARRDFQARCAKARQLVKSPVLLEDEAVCPQTL